MVLPWYESKLRWMAIPPASAKAIASLICRRSKYFSCTGIRADRTIGAQLARPVVVLQAEPKVAGGDVGDRGQDSLLGEPPIRSHVVLLAATQVVEDQPRFPATRQQPSLRGEAVDAELEPVSIEETGIERRVGL